MAAITRGLRWPCMTAITQSGLFIGRVGNQVIADANESEWTVGEVNTLVTLMRKGNQALNSVENIYNYSVGSIRAVRRNVASNFVDIFVGFRMQLITAVICHCERLR